MDKAGLLERSPDPRDRRATRIRLSARAEKLMPRALELLGQSNDEATAGLSAKEIETLHGLLRRVLANLAAMTDERS
jgi:MarR family transcriptional regulator for hemolysin